MNRREREKLEALTAVVRAVDVEIFGKQTAAHVQSDDYAKLLYERGVRGPARTKPADGPMLAVRGPTSAHLLYESAQPIYPGIQ